MKRGLELAWEQVKAGTDDSCDAAARTALAIADDSNEPACNRADAMFLLGQVARFLQPWRCPDEGESWFRRAIAVFPSHIDSVLALCEILVHRRPSNAEVIEKLFPRIEALRPSMTAEHIKQWDEIRRMVGS